MRGLEINDYNPSPSIYSPGYPFYVVTVGETLRDKAYRPKGIDDYQLLYTCSGEGVGIINGNEVNLTENTIFFLPPYTPHEYYTTGGIWETKWITFNGSGAEAFFGNSDTVCAWSKSKKLFFRLHANIEEAQKKLDFKEGSIILYKLLLEFKECSDKSIIHKQHIKNKLFSAMEYIYEHYRDDIEISELAAISNITQSHFCRMFKSLTGLRPVEYITRLKIARAKMLLVSSDISVGEVASYVGYGSVSYFIKQFRISEGITPADFRENKKYHN